MARYGARVLVNDIGASLEGAGRDTVPAQRVVDEIVAAGGEAAANTDSVAESGAGTPIATQGWKYSAGSTASSTTRVTSATASSPRCPTRNGTPC